MNYRKVPIIKWADGTTKIASDEVAVESVVSLNCNGFELATLLASPDELDHLMIGHLVCEGYVANDALNRINTTPKVESNNNGFEVSLTTEIPLLTEPRTKGITNTSCGACNIDGLDGLISSLPIIGRKLNFDVSILHEGMEAMRKFQSGFSKTGGMHCAGLLSTEGKLTFVSEDIGRHSAVDKVIGKAIVNGNIKQSILLLSGRCGWDIVAKAARADISTIASIGASSSLAGDCARQLGMKIYSFVRQNSATIIG
tara:strand:- start:1194 stop:1961 length:768 start_codon:yes stop_codon:yes gene_type:complete